MRVLSTLVNLQTLSMDSPVIDSRISKNPNIRYIAHSLQTRTLVSLVSRANIVYANIRSSVI